MAYSSLISIVKGVIVSIILFIFDKIFIALEWFYRMPQIVSVLYYVLIIAVVTFSIGSKTFINYWCATISFIVVSVALIVPTHNINTYIFSIINGVDSEMSAGDGFMLMAIFVCTAIACIVGLMVALVITIVNKKKSEHLDAK